MQVPGQVAGSSNAYWPAVVAPGAYQVSVQHLDRFPAEYDIAVYFGEQSHMFSGTVGDCFATVAGCDLSQLAAIGTSRLTVTTTNMAGLSDRAEVAFELLPRVAVNIDHEYVLNQQQEIETFGSVYLRAVVEPRTQSDVRAFAIELLDGERWVEQRIFTPQETDFDGPVAYLNLNFSRFELPYWGYPLRVDKSFYCWSGAG